LIIGLRENNNAFRERWLWANQQLVKNNILLEAQILNIDGKRF